MDRGRGGDRRRGAPQGGPGGRGDRRAGRRGLRRPVDRRRPGHGAARTPRCGQRLRRPGPPLVVPGPDRAPGRRGVAAGPRAGQLRLLRGHGLGRGTGGEPRAGAWRRGRAGRRGGERRTLRGGGAPRPRACARGPRGRDPEVSGGAPARASARRQRAGDDPRLVHRGGEAGPPELRLEGPGRSGAHDGRGTSGQGLERVAGAHPDLPRASPGLEGPGPRTRGNRGPAKADDARRDGRLGGLAARRQVRRAAGRGPGGEALRALRSRRAPDLSFGRPLRGSSSSGFRRKDGR